MVGALIETYLPVLVLDLGGHGTKFGHYSTGNRKLLMALEGKMDVWRPLLLVEMWAGGVTGGCQG